MTVGGLRSAQFAQLSRPAACHGLGACCVHRKLLTRPTLRSCLQTHPLSFVDAGDLTGGALVAAVVGLIRRGVIPALSRAGCSG